MGDLVHLPGAEPKDERKLIWVCVSCGCTTFHLHENASTECANCGKFGADNAEWRERLPPRPPADCQVENTDSNYKVTALDTAPNFIKRKAEAIKQALVIIIVRRDGDVNTWCLDSAFETDKQAAWLKRKLAEAVKMVKSACL